MASIPAPKTWSIQGEIPEDTVCGWDLSTRRSAAALMSPELRFHPVIRWTKSPAVKNLSIYYGWYMKNVLVHFESLPPMIIAMDWTVHESKIRGGRANTTPTMVKSFIAGVTYQMLKSFGHTPVFISPVTIRRFLQLDATASKPDVHRKFWITTNIDVRKEETHLDDAIILGWAALQLTLSGSEVAI